MLQQSVLDGTSARRPAPPDARLTTINGFASSNSTSNHFLGASQRPWMNGESTSTTLETSRAQLVHARPRSRGAANGGGRPTPSPSTTLPATNPLPHPPDVIPVSQSQVTFVSQAFSTAFNSDPSLATTTTSLARGDSDRSAAPPLARPIPAAASILTSSYPSQIPTPSYTGLSPVVPPPPPRNSTTLISSDVRNSPIVHTRPLNHTPLSTSTAAALPQVALVSSDHHPWRPPNSSDGATTSSQTLLDNMHKRGPSTPINPHLDKRARLTAVSSGPSHLREGPSMVQPLPLELASVSIPTFISYLPRLDDFMAQLRSQGHLRPYEAQRSSLLKEACVLDDVFYLCLHQVFCRATFDPLSTVQIGFSNEQIRGFDTLNFLLLSNNELIPNALQFFAEFPAPLPLLLKDSNVYGHVLAQVRAFLPRMRQGWSPMRDVCLKRGYPPSSVEMRTRLSLGSLVLQKILFHSIHRQLGGIDDLGWTIRALDLFEQNRRQDQDRIAQYGGHLPPSNEEVEAETRQLGELYTQLRASANGMATNHPPQSGNGNILPSNYPGAAYVSWQQANSASNASPPLIIRDQTRANAEPGYTLPSTLPLPTTSVQQVHPVPHQVPGQASNSASQSVHRGHSSSASHRGFVVPRSMSHLQQSTPTQQSPLVDSSPAANQSATPRRGRGRPPLSSYAQTSHRNVLLHGDTNIQPPPSTQSPHMNHLHLSRNMPQASRSQNHTQAGSLIATHDGRTIMATQNQQPVLTRSPQIGIPNTVPIPNQIPDPLLPDWGQEPIQTTNPDPRRVALHQAHLRSPIAQKLENNGTINSRLRLYQYLDHFALEPQYLGAPHFQWQFDLSPADMQTKVNDLSVPGKTNMLPRRNFMHGSRLYRLRCVEVPRGAISISQAEWAAKDTSWPICCFVSINNSELEIRRKIQHGKDMPLDLTSYVQKGNNTIKLSVIRTKEEVKKRGYAVAVEVILVADHLHIREQPSLMSYDDSINLIKQSLTNSIISDSDDVQVVDTHISIDVVDPFMATIFLIPVRGRTCTHRECFDLETFLQTRKSRTKHGLTSPDEWKCPICKRDARPQKLVVDGFLQEVRTQLEERNQLSTRAILVNAEGEWVPKPEKLETEKRSKRSTSDAGSTHGGNAEERLGGTERNSIEIGE